MKLKKIKKIMAYIYMPLFFSVIGYIIVYFLLSPIINPAMSALNMVVSAKTPDFSSGLNSIFVENDKLPGHDETPDTPNTSEVYVNEKDVQIPDYETHYARFEIESVSLKADLYFGDSNAVLKKGLGQYIGSSIPGYGRPLLIGGHNNSHFNKLKNIKVGDIIKITTNYGVYRYEIKETKILKSTDKSAFDLSLDKEQCILYTCYPFNTLGLTPNRFFVYADKVSGPDIRPN